jgi:tRNA1(Val) A37 N6-methylase TrmN6
MRYANETYTKNNGIVYTPRAMADYLSNLILNNTRKLPKNTIRILDPAIGDGELIISMLFQIRKRISENIKISVVGFETNKSIIKNTTDRIKNNFPNITIEIRNIDFINFILNSRRKIDLFDYIIANPPYVRTQILGAEKAQKIASRIKLTGRVDLYYAFLILAETLLEENGIAGFITSNKFMSIKAGNAVREKLINNTNMLRIIDFGDTKLFNAAVLPCIIVFKKGNTLSSQTQFTSIYEIFDEDKTLFSSSIFDVIDTNGFVSLENGRKYEIKQGVLEQNDNNYTWRLATKNTSNWLKSVNEKTWKKYSEIGKIKLGIKNTADNVFIKENWSIEDNIPELLSPLITHRNAGQIIPNKNHNWQVLYPYALQGNKKVTLNVYEYPNTIKYLEEHKEQLEKREYLIKANRNWYEIWVPQNPLLWQNEKIIFRDITEKPQFWFDNSGAIVNGDCYWIDLIPSLNKDIILLVLAISNSSFIEKYYDIKYNNKIYAGKRRFMAQYVSDFPLPDPSHPLSREAIKIVNRIINKEIFEEEDKLKLNKVVESIFS